MEKLFYTILELSIYGSAMTLLVALLRKVFKNIPRSFFVVIWALVAIRFIVPFEINTKYSVLPKVSFNNSISDDINIINDTNGYNITNDTNASGIVTDTNDTDNTNIDENIYQLRPYPDNSISNETSITNDTNSTIDANDYSIVTDTNSHGIVIDTNDTDNSNIDENIYQLRPFPNDSILNDTNIVKDTSIVDDIYRVAPYIWFLGFVIFVGYSLIEYLLLKRKVAEAIRLDDKENVFICDRVSSPFILGIFNPIIYLPSTMADGIAEYAVIHENVHIKRHDSLWKVLALFVLSVHWFNPVCWLAFYLFSKDVELACDEQVIKDMSVDERRGYSEAMLVASVPSNKISLTLSFGEISVKERIKAVLNYKKPALWISIASILAVILVVFLTSTTRNESIGETQNVSNEIQNSEASTDDSVTGATLNSTEATALEFIVESSIESSPSGSSAHPDASSHEGIVPEWLENDGEHFVSCMEILKGKEPLTTFYWEHKTKYSASSKRILAYANDKEQVKFFYDKDNFDSSDRIDKVQVNGKELDYVAEQYSGYSSINYVYSGFYFEGEWYDLLYKNNLVTGIAKDGEPIAAYMYYTYEDGSSASNLVMGIYGKNENGAWKLNSDPDFLGCMNKIRGREYIFDDSTGWCAYYPSDSFVSADVNNGVSVYITSHPNAVSVYIADGHKQYILPEDFVSNVDTTDYGFKINYVGAPYLSAEYYERQYKESYKNLSEIYKSRTYLTASVTVDENRKIMLSDRNPGYAGEWDYIIDTGAVYTFNGDDLEVTIARNEDVQIAYKGKTYSLANNFLYMDYTGVDLIEVFLLDMNRDGNSDLVISSNNTALKVFNLKTGKLLDYTLTDEMKEALEAQMEEYIALKHYPNSGNTYRVAIDGTSVMYNVYYSGYYGNDNSDKLSRTYYSCVYLNYNNSVLNTEYVVREPISFSFSTKPNLTDTIVIKKNGVSEDISFVKISELFQDDFRFSRINMGDWFLYIHEEDYGYSFEYRWMDKNGDEGAIMDINQFETGGSSFSFISNPVDIDSDGELEIVLEYYTGARLNAQSFIIDRVDKELVVTSMPAWPEFHATVFPDYQIRYMVNGIPENINEASGYPNGIYNFNARDAKSFSMINELWDKNGALTGTWASDTVTNNGIIESESINTWASEWNGIESLKTDDGYILSRTCYPAFISGAGGVVTYKEYYTYSDGEFEMIKWEMETY